MKRWTKDEYEYEKVRQDCIDVAQHLWTHHYLLDGWDVDKGMEVRGILPKYEFTVKRKLDRKVCQEPGCNRTAEDRIEYYPEELQEKFCMMCSMKPHNIQAVVDIKRKEIEG